MIIAIEVPPRPLRASHYLKVRDRASYEFAAASAAVGLAIEADGRTIRDVRVALGGVATKPWRVRAVEEALKGKPLTTRRVEARRSRAIEGAVEHGDIASRSTWRRVSWRAPS